MRGKLKPGTMRLAAGLHNGGAPAFWHKQGRSARTEIPRAQSISEACSAHERRSENPNVFRDRTEEWWHPQQGANARARFLLGMNETAPPGETPSSLAFYGMGTARCFTCQLL